VKQSLDATGLPGGLPRSCSDRVTTGLQRGLASRRALTSSAGLGSYLAVEPLGRELHLDDVPEDELEAQLSQERENHDPQRVLYPGGRVDGSSHGWRPTVQHFGHKGSVGVRCAKSSQLLVPQPYLRSNYLPDLHGLSSWCSRVRAKQLERRVQSRPGTV